MSFQDRVVRGGGPENSKADKIRHEEMRLKPMRYGFFRVPDGPKGNVLCTGCGKELNGPHTLINKQAFCSECLSASNKITR
jgi:hypothetical protein